MRYAGCENNLSMRALEVYIIGCKPPHCKGCHNKGLWNFNRREGYDVDVLLKDLEVETLRQRVFVMGGEPQDQRPDELLSLCKDLKEKGFEVWLFTRYYEVKDESLLPFLDYVKFGDYQEEKPSVEYFGLTLASNNQYIERIDHGKDI